MRVVLDVGRGDDDDGGRGEAEHDALERRDPFGVQVLDDLHQHGGVEPGQPVVTVGERGLEDRQPLALVIGHLVELEVAGGQLQRPGGHVDRDDVLDVGVREQVPGERAGAAAEVTDPARAACPDDGQDGLAALDRQRLALFFLGFLGFLGDGVVELAGLGVVGFGQPGQRGPGEFAAGGTGSGG